MPVRDLYWTVNDDTYHLHSRGPTNTSRVLCVCALHRPACDGCALLSRFCVFIASLLLLLLREQKMLRNLGTLIEVV